MLKVVFDLNSLSKVLIFEEKITGLTRVINELSMALLAIDKHNYDVFLQLSSFKYPQASVYLDNIFGELGYPDKIILSSKVGSAFYKVIVTNNLPLYKGQLLGKFISLFEKKNEIPDIFHSPFYPFPSKFQNNKTVHLITIHDVIALTRPEFFTEISQKKFLSLFEEISKSADHFISVSEHTKNEFCEFYNVSPKRITTVPLAASTVLFSPEDNLSIIQAVKNRYRIPEGEYILSVATLEPRKNIAGLIKAFYELLQDTQRKDLYLVLSGKVGWKMDKIITNLNINNLLKKYIIFTGHVDDNDLRALYSGALFFAYPSFIEGFGLPPLEAMQCGTPVISSNVSSIPEVVGDAGILIDPHSGDDLCHAMWQLLNNDKLRSNLASKGLERSKNFSWDKTAKMTLDLYRYLANS
ncbi:MAG: glycosyltransferase family 1 protein [Methylococcaceae bacterium]